MHPFVPFSSDGEVRELARAFHERTLPKPRWTHAAHFAVALALLEDRGLERALVEMPPAIRAYNESTGGENNDVAGYHETITRASLRAARDFRRRHPSLALFQACNAIMDSPFSDPHWLLAHWSRELLFGVAARRGWVEPDLAPLPF
jgi:hypothetical protein